MRRLTKQLVLGSVLCLTKGVIQVVTGVLVVQIKQSEEMQ